MHYANVTLVSQTGTLTAHWTVAPILILIVLILGLSGNSLLLFVFIKDRTLQTPFNIYVINLLTANILSIVLQYPWDLTTYLYNFSWPLDRRVCNLYIYALYSLQYCSCSAHLLICINRIWAVLSPLTYRNIHTKRIAFSLCVAMWVYVHIVAVPGIVMDAVWYRKPIAKHGCWLNTSAQYVWCSILQVLFLDVSLMVMAVALPIICYIKYARSRKSLGTDVAVPEVSLNGQKRNSARHHSKPLLAAMDSNQSTGYCTTAVNCRRPRHSSNGFLLLILLTCSVVITWTPSNVVYSIEALTDWDLKRYQMATNLLYCFQPAIDPVLFTFALSNLREALRTLFHCRWKMGGNGSV